MLRGFAVGEKDGKTITSVECINENDHVSVRFSDGRAICKAIKTIKE
jgi:exonuclease VII large subunit